MKRNTELYFLAAKIISATVGFLLVLMFRPVPPENKDALMMALGAVLAAFGSVVGYFFGSSKGSAEKTDVLLSKAAAVEAKLDAKNGDTQIFQNQNAPENKTTP